MNVRIFEVLILRGFCKRVFQIFAYRYYCYSSPLVPRGDRLRCNAALFYYCQALVSMLNNAPLLSYRGTRHLHMIAQFAKI
ncbi:hypothetical protein DC498_10215 [Terrimonas sp.]|nr:hypothetical protein DC498_10215 [Terrimonas sp.]